MRKIIALVAVVLFSMVGLFALTGYVTWTWFENDSEVQYYRYQLDGEDDSKWTVVDRSVNELTLLLDLSEVHTLYLQQSYDGENWSESSIVDSEVFTEETQEVTDESTEAETEQAPEEEPVKEEPATEEPAEQETTAEAPAAPEVPKYIPIKALDYGLGYLNSIPDGKGPRALGAFVSYTRTFSKFNDFDFGVKANASFYASVDMFSDISSTALIPYVNTLAVVSVRVGNSDIFLGFGPEVGFNFTGSSFYRVGVSAELGIRFHRAPHFSLGIAFADHQYFFPTTEISNAFDVRIFVSSVF